MKINNAGLDLIKRFEGLKLKPYLCSAKVPTIGYGNTFYPNKTKVKMTDAPITKEYAEEIFSVLVEEFAQGVRKLLTIQISENQFNALVSFAYNVGVGNLQKSTLLKLVNINPNDGNIAKEFLKWNKAGGKVLKGLTNRRIAESQLYHTK